MHMGSAQGSAHCRRRHRGHVQPSAALSVTPELAGIIAFSLLPFAAVQALADSSWGKSLQV